MRSRCCVQALSCVPASGLSRPAVINPVVCWSSFAAGSSSFVQSATMKRRNALDGKSRRPVKRTNKISENFYGRWVIIDDLIVFVIYCDVQVLYTLIYNILVCCYITWWNSGTNKYIFYFSTLVYVKLLLLWALVLLADHFLEFRFEYLWPFWLFLRSVYDSFKYQGLVSTFYHIVLRPHSKNIIIPIMFYLIMQKTHFYFLYFRHSQYSSFALRWQATWFVFSLYRSIGCFLLPVPTSGFNMCGIPVRPSVLS